MALHFITILTVSIFVFCSCSQHSQILQDSEGSQGLSDKIGEWKNIHKGSPKLAGVIVNQYPDNAGAPDWEHKHPRMIMYFMWDGTVHETHYRPDGSQIVEQEYWGPVAIGHEHIWHDVDFSYGSDPNFESHRDPRLNYPLRD